MRASPIRRWPQLALAGLLLLHSCSPDADGGVPPPFVEVRLCRSPAELIGDVWSESTVDPSGFSGAHAIGDVERVVVRWGDEHSLSTPAKLVWLSQWDGRVTSATISPLPRPLPWLEAVQSVEDFVTRHGAIPEPGFEEALAQWRLDEPKVEADVHVGGIRTYPSESRALRATFAGGQGVHLEIENYRDEGWIVTIHVNRSDGEWSSAPR